jgi:hypothetical protein
MPSSDPAKRKEQQQARRAAQAAAKAAAHTSDAATSAEPATSVTTAAAAANTNEEPAQGAQPIDVQDSRPSARQEYDRKVAEARRERVAHEKFEAALEQAAADLGDVEREDFEEWLVQHDLMPDQGSVDAWRASAEYESTKMERLANECDCDGACTCTYDGEGLGGATPGVDCDYHSSDDHTTARPTLSRPASPHRSPVPAYLLDRDVALHERDRDVPTYVALDHVMKGCTCSEDRRWVKEHLRRMASDEREFLEWNAAHGAARDAQIEALESQPVDFYWALEHQRRDRIEWRLRKK